MYNFRKKAKIKEDWVFFSTKSKTLKLNFNHFREISFHNREE